MDHTYYEFQCTLLQGSRKVNQPLGMIKRNFKYLFKCSLVTLYKTFVSPNLECCAPF